MRYLFIFFSFFFSFAHAEYYKVEEMTLEALSSGVDVLTFKNTLSEKGLNISEKDQFGDTLLHQFIQIHGDQILLEDVIFIVKVGSDLNSKNTDQSTPLHELAKTDCSIKSETELGKFKRVANILKTNENVNMQNVSGHTPFFLAISSDCQDEELLRLLVTSENVNKADKEGITPRNKAEEKGNQVALNIIKEISPATVPDSGGVSSSKQESQVEEGDVREKEFAVAELAEPEEDFIEKIKEEGLKKEEEGEKVEDTLPPATVEISDIEKVMVSWYGADFKFDNRAFFHVDINEVIENWYGEDFQFLSPVSDTTKESESREVEEKMSPSEMVFDVEALVKKVLAGETLKVHSTCQRTGFTYTLFIPRNDFVPGDGGYVCEIYLNDMKNPSWRADIDLVYCSHALVAEFKKENCGNSPFEQSH